MSLIPSRRGWRFAAIALSITALASFACTFINQLGPQLDSTPGNGTASPVETETPSALATAPPQPTRILLPTDTPSPTPTPAPFLWDDDFERNDESWVHCEFCEWEAGVLTMGPFPNSAAFRPQYTICAPCGLSTNFRMEVDVAYGSGPSERGYGFLLKLTREYLVTLEITPWQEISVWEFETNSRRWSQLDNQTTGSIRPGRGTNRIQVDVTEDGSSRMVILVTINGNQTMTVKGPANSPGHVGLTIFGHAVSASFDNFEFEEFEPYQDREVPQPPSKQGRIRLAPFHN